MKVFYLTFFKSLPHTHFSIAEANNGKQQRSHQNCSHDSLSQDVVIVINISNFFFFSFANDGFYKDFHDILQYFVCGRNIL